MPWGLLWLLMRTLLFALFAALVVAPAAAAEYYEGKPECPPDEFCTTSVDEDPDRPVDDSTASDGDIVDRSGEGCDEDDMSECFRHTGVADGAVDEDGRESAPASDDRLSSADASALGVLAVLAALVGGLALLRRH